MRILLITTSLFLFSCASDDFAATCAGIKGAAQTAAAVCETKGEEKCQEYAEFARVAADLGCPILAPYVVEEEDE